MLGDVMALTGLGGVVLALLQWMSLTLFSEYDYVPVSDRSEDTPSG